MVSKIGKHNPIDLGKRMHEAVGTVLGIEVLSSMEARSLYPGKGDDFSPITTHILGLRKAVKKSKHKKGAKK